MTNPFATKFWLPGTKTFQFPNQNENTDALWQQAQQYRICQIVGPHGSGKSTLLAALMQNGKKEHENILSLTFNEQRQRIPKGLTFHNGQILFVDGFEQLPLYDRLTLFFRSRKLLLTVHQPVWFIPVLYRAQPHFHIFEHIVLQMIPHESDAAKWNTSLLREVYERAGGNFRNAFFELYDLWEARR